MRVSKSRLIFASLMILMIIGSVYSQDAAKQERAQATKRSTQGTQQAAKESEPRPLTPTATQKQRVTPTPTQAQVPLKLFVFTEECFNKLSSGILDIDCIKFSISKLLSYGIIGGSLLYKAPQIIKILGSGSVEGLSLSGFYFQLTNVLFTIGYNIHLKAPITTYAENISVMVQTAIIIVLYWKFNPKTSRICVLASTGLFAAIGGIMYLDILPEIIYKGIGVINIVLFILAVYPQIKLNFQNKSTGQLALLTILLAWAGNVARVFTTLQEVNDPLLLAFFLIGSSLNGILLSQFFIYRGKVPKDSKKE